MPKLELLDTQESLAESTRAVFGQEPTPRLSAFFLAVSQVIDLYRFRHEGPVQARRTEALSLLKQQIDQVRHTPKHKFTEHDDLARRALMFAHKADILAVISSGEAPHNSLDGFAEDADCSSATLNSHLSYTRRQYIFDGLRKVADHFG